MITSGQILGKLAPVLLLCGILFSARIAAHAQGQDIGGSYDVDGYGEVEQSTYILASSDNTEIDAYTETDNWDFSGEDIEYVGALGELLDNGSPVDSPNPEYGYDSAYVPLQASTHVGDTYAVVGQSGACYYTYDGDDDDGGDDDDDDGGDCEFVTFQPFGYQISTAVPQISSISPNSANQGSSGSFTVQGQNLVDAFGYSQANISGSGVQVSVQNPDSNNPNSVTVNYSISSDAAIGADNFSISTSFGESDYAKFTVGYPPAVVTNINPSLWTAGTSFTLTITGTNFGTSPSVGIAAPGVSVGASTSSGGTQITMPITVAASAPNESVPVTVTPGYGGSGFTCGSCNGSSGTGTSTAQVQAVTPAPQIMFNGTNISGTTQTVMAGQQIALSVVAPQGYNIVAGSGSWSFSNQSAVTGGFVDGTCTAGTQPSASGGGCEASDPALNQQSLTFYWVNPGDNGETVTYTCMLNNNQPASATATFNIGGPTGNVQPNVFVQTGNSAAAVLNPTSNPATLSMYNAPGMPQRGIWFNDNATLPSKNPGTYIWVQLLHSVNYSQIEPSTNPYPSGTNQSEGLDGVFPYPALSSNTTGDTPSIAVYAGEGESGETFGATMYLLWDPTIPKAGQTSCTPAYTDNLSYKSYATTCSSIPVPLGSVNWSWSACTINALPPPAGPSWFEQCGAAQATSTLSSEYPTWNHCDTSFNGKCQASQ